MFICVAGKNNIAVDVLEFLVKKRKRDELGVICNQNENGVNGWQKSLRFFAGKYGVKEYKLEELYNKKQLVFLSLEFDKIINPEKFNDARLYNIHFSLLPQYKGMYTSAIPILNGEKFVGVTLHKIDSGIDTGDMIAQKKFELENEMNCRELYLKYIDYGTKLVLEYMDDILNDTIVAIPQPSNHSTYYSKKYLDYSNLEINISETACCIDRQIRAFNFREYQMPVLFGKKIIGTKITNIKSNNKPGTILMKDTHGLMLSTIDYNIVLFYDRFEELLDACREGNIDLVKDICCVKEHINAVNEKGWTPLIVATYNNQIDVARYLILEGADIYAKNNNGTNLLMYAMDAFIRNGNKELFEMYCQMGLEVNSTDYEGNDLKYYLEKEGLSMETLKNDNPLVTVIMSSFNHEKYVGQAIESVLNQSYDNLEFLIADDGSKDNSAQIIKSYNDKRIKRFIFEENTGFMTWDVMRQNATGKYIACIGSDDIWHVDKIKTQVDFLEKNQEYEACFTWVETIDGNGNIIADNTISKNDYFNIENKTQEEVFHEFFYMRNMVAAPSFLMRTDIYREFNGFNFKYRQIQDYELWIRFIQYYNFYIIPEKLLYYRWHVKEENQNISAPSKEGIIRTYNELFHMYGNIIEKMQDDIFVKMFKKELKNKNACTCWEIMCEKFFILANHPKMEAQQCAINYYLQHIDEEKFKETMEEKYHFTRKDFHELQSKIGVFEEKVELKLLIEEYKTLLNRAIDCIENIGREN